MRELIICAGANEEFSFANAVGVGMVDSAIKLSAMLARGDVARVIFVGTCGLYDESRPLLELYEASTASNVELSCLVSDFYSPLKLSVHCALKHEPTQQEILENKHYDLKDARTNMLLSELENIRQITHDDGVKTGRAFDPSSEAAFAKASAKPGELDENVLLKGLHFGLPRLGLNSSNYICTKASAAKLFLANALVLENMEGYAIAQCAKVYNVEARLILCATNYCNEHASEQFRKNHLKAKQIINDFAVKNLNI